MAAAAVPFPKILADFISITRNPAFSVPGALRSMDLLLRSSRLQV